MKSFIVDFIIPLRESMFNPDIRILSVSEKAGSVSTNYLSKLRYELETNQRILEDFGSYKGFRKWTQNEFKV